MPQYLVVMALLEVITFDWRGFNVFSFHIVLVCMYTCFYMSVYCSLSHRPGCETPLKGTKAYCGKTDQKTLIHRHYMITICLVAFVPSQPHILLLSVSHQYLGCCPPPSPFLPFCHQHIYLCESCLLPEQHPWNPRNI